MPRDKGGNINIQPPTEGDWSRAVKKLADIMNGGSSQPDNSSGGGNGEVTQNITINNNYSTPVAQSWIDWGNESSTSIVTDVLGAIDKLSGILEKYDRNLRDLKEMPDILDSLRKDFSTEKSPYGMEETIKKYIDFTENPSGSVDAILMDVEKRVREYWSSGGKKYKDSGVGQKIDSNLRDFYGTVEKFSSFKNSGDVVSGANTLFDLFDQANKLKMDMFSAVRRFAEYDKDPAKWEAEQKRQLAKIDAANKRAAEAQRQATEAQKARAGKLRTRVQTSGGNSGSGDSDGAGIPITLGSIGKGDSIVKVFKSAQDLYDYLNGFKDDALSGTVKEIQGWLSAMNSDARGITASFNKVGDKEVLSNLVLSAVNQELGKGGVSTASFRYKMDDGKYQMDSVHYGTVSDIDKGEKYREELSRRTEALKAQVKAMLKLPILDADPTGGKKNPLREQLETIAKINEIGADGGIQLINVDSLSALEKAEGIMKALDKDVSSYNQRMSKKMANRGIEQMPENVKDMEAQVSGLKATFNGMGILDKGWASFIEFKNALAEYEKSVGDPNAMIDNYNRMFAAVKQLNRIRSEENGIISANNRVKQKAKKIGDENLRVNTIEKTRLSKYDAQYKQMGQRAPQQMKDARNAVKRYRNATTDEEREEAYRQINENAAWMKDDLAVTYPKWKEKEKRSAKLKKDNSTRYWNGRKQTQQINNVRKELAEIAQPYGGLSADDLPDFITDVLKQITAAQNEKDPSVKAKQVSSLKDALKLAKESNKQVNDIQEANGLLEKIANTDSLADTEVHNNLQDALYRVTTLSQTSSSVEQADAWANLTANIKAASEALKEYDKAQTDSKKEATAQERLNTSYEQYLAQINTIKTAYEKMGKTIDTSKLEGEGGLLDQLMGADVNDKNAVAEAQAKIRQELTRLRVQRQRDTVIFNAENQRDAKAGSLNKWIDGLGIDDVNLDKIKTLKELLRSLVEDVDFSKSEGLEKFSNVMSQITETERKARMQVDTMQRYRRVTGDKDMELIDNGHLTEKQKTEGDTRRKALTEAYNTFNSAQGDVEALRKLNDELRQMEAYLANVSKWDTFGKLGEQVTNYMGQLDLMKQKQGDVSKWKPGQQQMYNEMQELQRKYNTQVDAGDMTGAADSASKLENHIKALNQSFASGGGFVGIYEGKITKLATRLLGLGSGFMAFNKVLGTMRKMAGYVTQIDTAMTELRKVTDESSAAYTRFQKQSGQTAVQIGSSIFDLINTSVEYGRMGYSLAESQQLGVVTTKFANTGNFNSVTDASDALIAIIRGFDGLEVSDAEAVSDKLTAVANAYAVTASDIATGLQRSASALNMGGVNVDQATAMITAISEVTRDSASAGNAIKTLSMRVRGAKTE